MRMPKQKTQAQLEAEIIVFNNKFKVGDTVNVTDDRGGTFIDRIKHPATVMGGHSAMAWLENKGSYLAERVTATKQ